MTAFYRLDAFRRVRLASIQSIAVRHRITMAGEMGIVTITTDNGTHWSIECETSGHARDVAADIERKASAGMVGTEDRT